MLSSRYRLVRKLAEGGMAEILLADYEGDDGLMRQVVIKRILSEFSKDQAFATMFMGEAKLVAKFNHPNIVGITDFGIDDGRYYLAMEYVDGFHLRALFKRAEALGRPVPFDLAARMVAQACQGLGYAHAFAEEGQPLNLIHRDVSPENLLIGRNGVVKVADFGIARVEGQVRTTRAGMVKGKLAYMAPEQLLAGPVDHRVDIFAMGIVLFELCCGRKPFDGPTDGAAMQAIIDGRPTPLSALRPDAPPALQEIIDRAMASAPHDRYQSCGAMQQALERFSSRASPQALAVFVADIAPVESVTEAKTGLVASPAAKGEPQLGKTLVRGDTVNTARTVLIEPEPDAPKPAPIADPPRPAVAAAPPPDPAAVADTLPPRMAPAPVAATPHHWTPSDEGRRPATRGELVMFPAPAAPAGPQLRALEPSGEIIAAAGLRRPPLPWKLIAVGAGVLLLVGGSFALGRMGGGVENEAKPEPKAGPAPSKVAEPTPSKVAERAAPPEPAPEKKAPPPAKPPVRAATPKKPAPRAEKPAPAPAPEPTRREAPAEKFSGVTGEWSGLGAPPTASPATPPPPRELIGRIQYRPSMGYVVSNDTDFVWHRCEVRLPNGKFYPFHSIPLEPHRQYNLGNAVLQLDPRAADAYIIQGYAQLSCDEGRKYILVAN